MSIDPPDPDRILAVAARYRDALRSLLDGDGRVTAEADTVADFVRDTEAEYADVMAAIDGIVARLVEADRAEGLISDADMERLYGVLTHRGPGNEFLGFTVGLLDTDSDLTGDCDGGGP